MSRMNIRIERKSFGQELLDLSGEWEELLQRSSRPTVYSCFDYVYTSCIHFQRNEEIFFLLFRNDEDGRLLAIFPLSLWEDRVYGVRIKRIEHGITTVYTDVDKPYPIIDQAHEQVCWKRFSEYFRKEFRSWDLIVYDELLCNSALNRSLKDLFPFPSYWTKRKVGPDSPIVALDGLWEEFLKQHDNLRRKNRRIETRLGERLSYRVFSDPGDVKRCLNEYIATEMLSWKSGEGVSQEKNQHFYHDLLPRLADRGLVYFGMLYDGPIVISAEISYVYMDRVFFALGTYNPEYRRLSPGTISTARFMEFFHGKGYTDGDFLAGFAQYVNPWTCRIETSVDVAVRRMGWKNWYLAGRYLAIRVRRMLRRPLRAVKKEKLNETEGSA